MNGPIELEEIYGAANYEPLPVVLVRGEGVYLWDDEGRRYLDMMGAYSAVSHGHCHPRLVGALKEQAARLGVVSRAFYTDLLGPFLERASELTGLDAALPMNTGAEAVETALKAARKWAYAVKGAPSPSSACRPTTSTRTGSAPSRKDLPAFPLAMSRRLKPPSRPRPPPSWSNRSRAKAASSCRPTAISRHAPRSAKNKMCC
jgi:ornithine--oxo-acid transaminase